MDLHQFVKSLPGDFVLAPIYRKGATMRSGKAATGKNPHESGHERNLDSHNPNTPNTPVLGVFGLGWLVHTSTMSSRLTSSGTMRKALQARKTCRECEHSH